MKIFILLIICGIEFGIILWGAYRMVRINGTAKVIQEALDEWHEEEKETETGLARDEGGRIR